jgi:hypothetical protein
MIGSTDITWISKVSVSFKGHRLMEEIVFD